MKRNRIGTEEQLMLLDATKQQQQQKQPSEHDQATVYEGVKKNSPPIFGQFLERCHYCKKYMPVGVEVFMYRDFCGFCSVGCREIQISLDKLVEKQVELTKKQQKSCCNHEVNQ